MRLIDLSQPIYNSMPVYPGDTATTLKQAAFLEKDFYNNYRLDTGMHAGTHIDSPMHLTNSSQYICEAPLDSFFAPGILLDVRNMPVIEYKAEYDLLIKPGCIVLFYTGWDRFYGMDEYYSNHPCISMELCRSLIDKKIKMLGLDCPSPDKPPFEVHKMLFRNNIYLMENMANLEKLLGVDGFEVIALPLKIKADSSPVRAVARII